MSTTPSDMSPPMAALDERDVRSSVRTRSRRAFELGSPSDTEPPTPTEDPQAPPTLQIPSSADGASTPSRTRSILNLTSSTLFGIYQPTGYNADREEPSTPWGTGSETPLDSASRQFSFDFTRANIPDTFIKREQKGAKLRRRSTVPASQIPRRPRRGFTGYLLPLLGKNIALFTAGVLYGLLITHLHDRRGIAPVKIDLDRSNWKYLTIWGLAGAALGQALPWIDALWAYESDEDIEDYDDSSSKRNHKNISSSSSKHHQGRKGANLSGLEGWMDVIRSIGVFVGIAFAIRKLPWQSTLQLSLTLALANPAVWYLIDRSPPGFVLSTFFAFSGTALLLATNPALVPSPSMTPTSSTTMKSGGANSRMAQAGFNGTSNKHLFASDELVFGMFSQESVGVVTWIASVLFVSSVCFGNIGRRLAS